MRNYTLSSQAMFLTRDAPTFTLSRTYIVWHIHVDTDSWEELQVGKCFLMSA